MNLLLIDRDSRLTIYWWMKNFAQCIPKDKILRVGTTENYLRLENTRLNIE